MEGDVITMQDIFVFERTGVTRGRQGDGPVPGDRHPSQVRRAARRRRACTLPIEMFEHVQAVA